MKRPVLSIAEFPRRDRRGWAVPLLLSLIFVAGCTTAPPAAKPSPHFKIGAPYKIKGRWYTPAADPDYREVGVASWYGSQFHGKPTANGEIFDRRLLSAAHKTLPLPSLVLVENLENGRSLTLRVNDRGPFADDRIIDLSQAAARALGFEEEGLARVRVSYVDRAPLTAKAEKPGARRPATRTARNRPAPAPQGTTPQPPDGDLIADLINRQQSGAPHDVDKLKGHWVRVDEFDDRNLAQAVQFDLSDIGASRIDTVWDGERERHAVLFGPFDDEITADAWRAAILDAGYPNAKLASAVR